MQSPGQYVAGAAIPIANAPKDMIIPIRFNTNGLLNEKLLFNFIFQTRYFLNFKPEFTPVKVDVFKPDLDFSLFGNCCIAD